MIKATERKRERERDRERKKWKFRFYIKASTGRAYVHTYTNRGVSVRDTDAVIRILFELNVSCVIARGESFVRARFKGFGESPSRSLRTKVALLLVIMNSLAPRNEWHYARATRLTVRANRQKNFVSMLSILCQLLNLSWLDKRSINIDTFTKRLIMTSYIADVQR